MPRLVLTNVQMGDGRGPALRAVEATVIGGKVAALAISGKHYQRGSVAPDGLRQVDPYSSPRWFSLIAAAVMREAGRLTTGA